MFIGEGVLQQIEFHLSRVGSSIFPLAFSSDTSGLTFWHKDNVLRHCGQEHCVLEAEQK